MIAFDFSELLAGRVDAQALATAAVLDVTNKMALDCQTNLRLATPVDTGNARDGWQVVRADVAFAQAIVLNPVQYIEPLILGHSSQAPSGWFDGAVLAAVTFGGAQ